MNTLFQVLGVVIIFLGVVNLIRMTLLLVGSDIYNLVNHRRFLKKNPTNNPKISVVIPAFNEEANIIKCVSSVIRATYPKEKLEVIVVNDGSGDTTYRLVANYIRSKKLKNLILVNQPNMGKANALNNGMKNYAKGELVMCLDADSYIDKNALISITKYFSDKKVMAVASNIKVEPSGGLLNVIQQMEYIVSYQMKRAQSLYNIEYIIGGIGSTFRKAYLEKIGYYDANTVTEDIDLTMKILRPGNKLIRAIYAPDSVCYTQGVLNIKDLIKQRFRWKWGRYQTFLKNKGMFFTLARNFTHGLTWIYLPFALWSDITFLFEPVIVIFILTTSIIFHDRFTIISAFSVTTFYLIMNILAEDTISIKNKFHLLLFSPFMYFFFYVLSFAEYIALIKSIVRLPKLKNSLYNHLNSWSPVQRNA